MKNENKYTRQFFPPPNTKARWVQHNYVQKAPLWCSVDLRDGNQALIIPMSLEDKLSFFNLLVKIGFKEIEVGFPAASETEYRFVRTLIEEDLIPADVTIQVLTQAREHIIKRTFASLQGAKKAIVHLYNSTSVAQREQVFRKKPREIIKIATNGAAIFNQYLKDGGNYIFEYSPESFTCTEPEFALEVCNEVLDIWQPSAGRKVIINLPATVQVSMPHVYANQVEYMCDNLHYRDNVIVSLHPHNDRGCAVADAELGLLAGADRVEGTLFGNGERTGNVDIVTLALNMYAQGVAPGLDFSNLPEIREIYEKITGMNVHERSPYSGDLVFAAFSGSHQDAIAKGMAWRKEKACNYWTVPYLPIDPKDVGREYETNVIRINSQSGKGGIGYVLERYFGYQLPAKMREDVGYSIKDYSDQIHNELSMPELLKVFKDYYVNINTPIKLLDYSFICDAVIKAVVAVELDGEKKVITATGNGRLDAVSNAVRQQLGVDFSQLTYSEHALSVGSSSQAVTYVSITFPDGTVSWGAGIHDDIIASSINALFSAINRQMGV